VTEFFCFEHFGREEDIIHAVTRKQQNASYAFSMALHTGEHPPKIFSNRSEVSSWIETRGISHFVLAQQTHSDHVEVVDKAVSRGWMSEEDAIRDCDALVTAQRGVMVGVMTADCVPILLYDRQKKVVAAVHAGWRGTHKRIVQKCITRMQQEFGSIPQDIIVGIAPAIGQCCYEVGEDVAGHFMKVYPDSIETRGDKYMLDLPAINKIQIEEMGVPVSQIEMSDICTSCENGSFFSYRQERGCSGRFLSLIGLRKE